MICDLTISIGSVILLLSKYDWSSILGCIYLKYTMFNDALLRNRALQIDIYLLIITALS